MGLTLHEYRMDLVRVTKKTITQQTSSGLKGDNLVSGTWGSGCEGTEQRDPGQGGAAATPLGSNSRTSQRTEGPVAHLRLGCHLVCWAPLSFGKVRHLGSRTI